jgi:hypothetical protein
MKWIIIIILYLNNLMVDSPKKIKSTSRSRSKKNNEYKGDSKSRSRERSREKEKERKSRFEKKPIESKWGEKIELSSELAQYHN